MDINGYPQFDNHYKLIQKIFDLLTKLEKHGVNIEIIKIPSHDGIIENNTADAIAKRAATIAKDCKFGKLNYFKYNQYFNPINVDISIDLKRLHYNQRQNHIKEWKLRDKEWKNGTLNSNLYVGKTLFHKMMLGHKGYLNNSTNDMKNELKYLKPYEASIITKLRTECINLNGYKYFRFQDDNNGYYEMCRYCNVPETVEHYLIDCPGQTKQITLKMNTLDTNYNASRNILKFKLKRIDSFFKNRANFNAINILFPHYWQLKPKRNDENYKIKLENGLKRRIYIFKEIIEFVHRTKDLKKKNLEFKKLWSIYITIFYNYHFTIVDRYFDCTFL